MADPEEQQRKRTEEEQNTKENYSIYRFIINEGKKEDIDTMDVMLQNNIIKDIDVRKPDIKNKYDPIKDRDRADNDYIGLTALMYQTLYGTEEAMKFLLDRGADPNIKSKGGCSLLQLLVEVGDYPDKVQLLLDKGANKNATCFKKVWSFTDKTFIEGDMTPLEWLKHARSVGRKNTIRILEPHVEQPYDGSDNPYGKGGARRNKSRKSKKSKKSKKSRKSRKSRRSRK